MAGERSHAVRVVRSTFYEDLAEGRFGLVHGIGDEFVVFTTSAVGQPHQRAERGAPHRSLESMSIAPAVSRPALTESPWLLAMA